MAECRSCGTWLEPVISFGQMPIANGFLTAEEFAQEYFFELAVGFCPRCTLVQLIDQPARELMFNEHYAFYSSTSKHMAEHFADYAAAVMHDYLDKADPFVVEIGSNDGIMLQNFAKKGIGHLGVEPSANVAQTAQARGINTLNAFFDDVAAEKIKADHGQADAIIAANVICHIPYLHSVAEGIARLLKAHGVFIFEEPYIGDIVTKTSYDQIYDEHVFFFSVKSVQHLFKPHGLEVIDVAPQEVHGGSMRYVLARVGARPVSASVARQLSLEKQQGLDKLATYQQLRQRIEKSRDDLKALLVQLKQQGKRVVGYGATSKSTTITNYAGITLELVEYIADTTPIKQGKYSPGAHIPVKPYEEFTKKYPDYALLFAWNHAQEIMAKEMAFKQAGGKWVVYVPNVTILG